MARKTKEEALNTRRSIMDAALEIFYQKGVRQASMEDIAAAAHVTRGAVYWHFENKADIFTALHSEVHTFFIDKLAHDVMDGNNVLDVLESKCTESLEDIARDPQKRKFFTVFFLKCDYSGDLADLLAIQNAQHEEMIGMVSALFQKAMDEGLIHKDSNPRLLAISLSCYFGGIVHEYLRNPGLMTIGPNTRPLVRLFFKGLV